MKKQTRLLFFVAIIFALQVAFIVLGALFKILHLPGANEILILSMGSMVFTTIVLWAIAIFQIISSSFENKVLWLFLMFIFPSATPVVFLLTKDERIKTA